MPPTTGRPRGRPRHPDLLTPAEWQVLHSLRHGLSRREIARRRATSVPAVRYHVANIAGKLGLTGGMDVLRHWAGVPGRREGDPAPMDPSADLRLGPLGQVSLWIRDVARAEAFYRDTLGLTHLFTFGDLVFFDLGGGTRLYLHRADDAGWRPGSILYLTVADLAATHEALVERAVTFSGAPHRVHVHDDGTEEWMAFFEDTEGNTLALISRLPSTPAGADEPGSTGKPGSTGEPGEAGA